jgi:hypothetical protein
MIEEHQVEIGELFKLANQAGVRPEYIIGPVFYFTGEEISPNMEIALVILNVLKGCDWNSVIPDDHPARELIFRSLLFLQENPYYGTNSN